jgi:toxin-antitoxin system PIN domain toxin
VIAVDTNILVHAHRAESPHFHAALRALSDLAEAREPWAIPWPCVHEFLAVVTKPRGYRRASTMEEAIGQVEIWLGAPNLVVLEETPGHWRELTRTIRGGRAVLGGMVHDARIAALCLEHGVRELWTADRDFSRFPELATFNPLVGDRVHDSSPHWAAAKRARAAGRRRALASLEA